MSDMKLSYTLRGPNNNVRVHAKKGPEPDRYRFNHTDRRADIPGKGIRSKKVLHSDKWLVRMCRIPMAWRLFSCTGSKDAARHDDTFRADSESDTHRMIHILENHNRFSLFPDITKRISKGLSSGGYHFREPYHSDVTLDKKEAKI